MKKIVPAMINKFKGHWNNVYDSILCKDKDGLENFYLDAESLANTHSIVDEEYSDKFKKMYMPPFALFFKGNIKLLDTKVFSIVGKVNVDIIESLKANDINADEYTLCFNMDEAQDGVLEQFSNENYKMIVLTQKPYPKLPEGNENLVYATEFFNIEQDKDPRVYIERLIYALADKLLLTCVTKLGNLTDSLKCEYRDCYFIGAENIKNIDMEFNDEEKSYPEKVEFKQFNKSSKN